MDVRCPRCGEEMATELVVCWPCYRQAKAAGIRNAIPRGWEKARDERVKVAEKGRKA